MTEPTDTNQASEDELVTEVTDILNNNLHPSCECQDCIITWSDSAAIPLVVELIRTEKLKLLAEVRERVVGEDHDIPAEMEKVGRDFQKLDAIAKTGGLLNKFKADLRAKLTKLEAEL